MRHKRALCGPKLPSHFHTSKMLHQMTTAAAARAGGRRQTMRAAATKRFSSSSSPSSPQSSTGKSGFRFAEALALAGGIGAAGVAITQGFVPHEWLVRQLSEPVLMPLVRLLDPETAHVVAVKAAALGLAPRVRRCGDGALVLK